MKLRIALLDMGGVLIDFGAGRGLPTGRADWRGREALAHYLSDRGRRVTVEDLENLLFAPWRKVHERRNEAGCEAPWDPHLKQLRRKAGVRTPGVTLLNTWFRPFGAQLELLPGAAEAVEALRRKGLALALISNVPLPGQLYVRVLRRLGLAGSFASLHFSYDSHSRKPSPAMLRKALADLRARPDEAIMVGDRRRADVAAGRTAGIATAWVKSDDGGGPRADVTVSSLIELAAQL